MLSIAKELPILEGMDGLRALRQALREYVTALKGADTQTALGKRLGLSQQSVSNLLNGNGNVTLQHLDAIARAQNKPVASVLLEVAARVMQLQGAADPPLPPSRPQRIPRQ